HDGGNQLVVLEDVDRRALARIGSVQGSHDGVLVEVIDVARQGACRHLYSREVLTVAGEALDPGVRPIGDIQPLLSRRYGDAVRGVELSVRGTLAAERQVRPSRLERIEAEDPRRQNKIQV